MSTVPKEKQDKPLFQPLKAVSVGGTVFHMALRGSNLDNKLFRLTYNYMASLALIISLSRLK